MKILAAGDGFVTTKVLTGALVGQDGLSEAVDVSSIQSNWPNEPYSDFSGVKEAFGNEDDLIAALAGVDVAFSHTYPFSERVIASCPDLKLITITRGGPVNVDIEAATRHGVVVSNAPGRNAVATAEHSVAMIMAAARQIAQRDSEVKAGDWRSDYYNYDAVGPEIAGSTVGVCGYGNVGGKVARILAAMGAHVIVFDPWVDPSVLEPGMELASDLDSMLERSSILTLHQRLTKENEHMIGAEQIAKLPDQAIVVNCARGGLLDYDAVADGLDSGKLFAAAFDALPEEPLPSGHRLFSTPRVTMTPHLGGASKQAAELAGRIGAADVARFVRGERPEHLMNPEVYEAENLRIGAGE